jgi:hypothetical protein
MVKLNKKNTKKPPESTDQTYDPSHETKKILLNANRNKL